MARPHDRRGAGRAGRPRACPCRAGERGSRPLTSRRAALATGLALVVAYLLTLAPGVTFWDAGEFIAAAHGFGIPHPPGTPLYVALGRAWIVAVGWLTGSARATNLLSAIATAAAGALTVGLVAREARASRDALWGAAAAALVAGFMCSVWANATETEVYAVALLHAVGILACAARAGDEADDTRWLSLTAYLIALAPALHLSALVAAPAAVALAARDASGRWSVPRAALLAGVTVSAAGVGRVSLPLAAAGAVVQAGALWFGRRGMRRASPGVLLLVPLAASALLVMLVRARHDPLMNQGNPATLGALADVIARRQYAVSGLLPRRAPVWLQLANVAQYADWQVAMAWGHGIFTTAARVTATLAYLALGIVGWRAMRRESPRLATALVVLLVSGSLGVAAYLNLSAGASLGWGVLPDTAPHEARERDYFFILGFWAWGCLAGWGALALARRRRRPSLALLAALVPLVGNWTAVDRAHGAMPDAARRFALALLAEAPRNAALFTSGDNDSYPLWYLQQVEGVRPDVHLVTLPLLPATWYGDEVSRRSGWRWDSSSPEPGMTWRHEAVAAAIADAARRAGNPVVASPGLTARERALLGSGWVLQGPLFVAGAGRGASPAGPAVDTARARAWLARLPASVGRPGGLPDDVALVMLGLLQCPRLGLPWAGPTAERDSLEVRCNFR